MRGSAKSDRRTSEGLLALLAPCWDRDLEIPCAEQKQYLDRSVFCFAWGSRVQISQNI
jgi:hypothetical protein